jgi:hypothetical protein
MSGEIGLGLFLNVLFWAAMVAALVFACAWTAAYWFPGTARKLRKSGRPKGGRDASPHPSPAEEPPGERLRKAS